MLVNARHAPLTVGYRNRAGRGFQRIVVTRT
jgi:hypothetical protein